MIPKRAIALAHAKADVLCIRAVKAIHDAGIKSYKDVPAAQLAKRLRPTLAKQLEYLEQQDLDEWQRFTAQIIESRIQEGVSPWDVIHAGQLMLAVLDEFFRAELGAIKTIDGQDASKVLTSVMRRLQGMNTVATTVAMNVGLKNMK